MSENPMISGGHGNSLVSRHGWQVLSAKPFDFRSKAAGFPYAGMPAASCFFDIFAFGCLMLVL